MIVPSFKSSAARLAFGAGVVVLGVWLAWLWQPDRQLRKHQDSLIAAAEHRSARKVAALMASDYSDPWNASSGEAVARLGEVLRNYFTLSIRESRVSFERTDRDGVIVSHLSLDGKGTPIAEFVTRRTNALTQPFTFRWRKESWKPWDWKLARVENPSLEIGSAGDLW